MTKGAIPTAAQNLTFNFIKMKTISQPTKEELKKAEEKFNRLHNRFYTALSILHDATAELPQKGNTAEECQKISLICAINDLEAKLNGVCIEDFLNK